MGQIALQDYLSQITDLIDESRLDEAAAHCRKILEQHPRHVETYRLLGRTLLELQVYDEASDIFQRVLSAVPDDLVSHLGLAASFSEADELARAIWHMERAMDIAPYNRAIQVELSELTRRRDNQASEPNDMSRAALARLYMGGSMYSLAIAEFKSLLSEDPSRVDFQLGLAESLFRDGRLKEAAQIASEVIDKLPLCITANAILASVWSESGRADRAKPHLMRLRSLTLPEISDLGADTITANVLEEANGDLLPKQIFVDDIDYIPFAGAETGDSSDWTSTDGGDLGGAEGMPEWLREFSDNIDSAEDRGAPLPDSNPDAISHNRASDSTGEGPGQSDSDNTRMDLANFFGDQNVKLQGDILGRAAFKERVQGPFGSPGEEMQNWPGQAGNQIEFNQFGTLIAQGHIAQANQESIHPVGILAPEFSGLTVAPDDSLNDTSQSESDPNPQLNWQEVAGESEDDDSPDEPSTDRLSEEISEDSSESIDPPDWLYETVGLAVISETSDNTDASSVIDDIIAKDDSEESELSESELPDWLADTLGVEIEEPDPDQTTRNGIGSSKGDTPDTERPMNIEDLSITPDVLSENQKGESPYSSVGEEYSMEVAMIEALEDPDRSQKSEQNDLDGELKWLEELAASHDAGDEDIAESFGSLDPVDGLSGSEDYIPDWLKADILDDVVDEGSLLDESSHFTGEELGQVQDDGKTMPSQEVPDWLQKPGEDETISVDDASNDAMDWFSQIAAGDESAIDELLTSQGVDLGPDTDGSKLEPADGQPSWLTELEKLDENREELPSFDSPVEEFEPPAAEIDIDTPPSLNSSEFATEGDPANPDLVPSDPEDAMAWLEQLAFRQGVVGDDAADDLEQATEGDISFPEIDVGGDYTIDSAEDLSTKVPEDPDEAMAWLEQLAAEQGEPTDELITYSDETADDPFAELEEAIVDEDLELALTGLEDVAMPADEDEALIWLAELGGAGGTEFVESPAEELQENEIVIEEGDILEEVVADEIALDSEAQVEEDVASMATSLATAPEHEEDSQIPIVVSDEVEKIEDDQTSDMVFDQVAAEVEPGPSISSDIAEDDDLAWLDSLDEANVTGWLQSEEALLSDDSSAEIAPQVAPAEIIPELEIVSDQPPSILDELDLADQLGEHESSELSAAQIALKSGQIDEAKVAYSGLIDSGESLPYVISDLETAVAAYDDQPALKRLLGDAYARNGQLQKAIEVYRQALNNL